MKIIEQVEIKNFRSFGNRKGETTKVTKVAHLNVISGANDSGKSNVLRGLNLFFNGFTDLNQFFEFERDYFKKAELDENDVKEELTTIKIWFHNEKNSNKNSGDNGRVFLPERFWVSKKWKKTTQYSQSDISSNIELSFKHEKGEFYDSFLEQAGTLKSMTKASLQKQLTDFLSSIQYHYIPAIKDREYFSHLYGELQQTLWKADKSSVDVKKVEFEEEIQNETLFLMEEFKETLNHPSLNFEPAFELPQNMIDLFRTLQVKTGDVDLRNRGDGVQAKLIPEILHFIAVKERSLTNKTVRKGEKSKKYFVWGFEEPENSYEYKNAQLLADRFKDKFVEHAQIFLTTHSFNFVGLKGHQVSRYRVWKDQDTIGSKISKLKENSTGKIELEGHSEDQDTLFEELGFFHLNEEIKAVYEKVQSLKEEYSKKIASIDRPVLYTEGKNTNYLETARTIFSETSDYDIESLGGKSDITKFFRLFSTANFNRYKIAFVFDCDAKSEFEACQLMATDHLKPILLPQNESNSIPEVQNGIENMFDDDYFIDETQLFSITETKRDGLILSRKRTLRKNEFERSIIESHANCDAFRNFQLIESEVSNFFKER